MSLVNIGEGKDSEAEPKIIKLSASAVKTYESCPKKYYYNYIEKVARKQWPHFDLGNLCHITLEKFHEIYMVTGLKGYGTYTNLMGKCFEESRKEFPNMNINLVKEAKDMLMIYLERIKSEGMPNVIGVEAGFNMDIGDNIIVRGFLDRLDIMKDGLYHIVDYKTTRNKKYLDPFQLSIYGLWLKREYPEIKEFVGSYSLLRHNSELLTYKFNLEDLDKTKKKLLEYADKISNENTWITLPTRLCDWCDFQEVCPAHDMTW